MLWEIEGNGCIKRYGTCPSCWPIELCQVASVDWAKMENEYKIKIQGFSMYEMKKFKDLNYLKFYIVKTM